MPANSACPVCGIYFHKWKHARQALERRKASVNRGPLFRDFAASLLEPMEPMGALNFYRRCTGLLLLALWSWSLIGYDYRTGEMGDSFMHNILLVFHEAGHLFLRPFGEFMMVLGGSLFQLALPFAIAVVFIVKNGDNFGAALGLWWCGTSWLDLSPYIYDSLQPRLILLSGETGEAGGHDWIYLFNALGQLHNAHMWGAFAHLLGAVVTVGSLAWAAAVLWRQRRNISGQSNNSRRYP